MKQLPDNYYELDGYTQLLVCGCEWCKEILEDLSEEDIQQYKVDKTVKQ